MDERHANSPSPYSHRSRFLGILGSTTGQRAKVNSSSPFPAGSKNVSALHVEPAIVATSAGLQQSRCPCLMLSRSQKLQAGAASSSPATGVGHTEPSRKVEPRGDTLVSTLVARVIPAALLCRGPQRSPIAQNNTNICLFAAGRSSASGLRCAQIHGAGNIVNLPQISFPCGF